MIPRYIIRPSGIYTTPKILRDNLGAKRTLAYPFTGHRRPSLLRDFFLSYPPEEDLQEYASLLRMEHPRPGVVDQTSRFRPRQDFSSPLPTLDHYRVARGFAISDKPTQRSILSSDTGGSFPAPPTASSLSTARDLPAVAARHQFPSRKFIVRPLRHTQGRGWRLTEDPCDFQEGSEYIQAIYPKNHEYRVIAVRGVPIITLLKRVPPDLPRSQPWNNSNGSIFITVHNPSLDRLRHCDVYSRINQSSLLQCIDLAGIDIMYRCEGEYAVTEVNLCPALTIPDNIEKVARHVHSLS